MPADLVTGLLRTRCFFPIAVTETRRDPTPVLTAPTQREMARLSRPGGLVKYQDGIRSPILVLTRTDEEQPR